MDNYEYLAHYGTRGQKWGFRRFQNEDGTLTPAGRERYGVGPARANKKVNAAELAVYETGYQVKKAARSLQNDAKQIAKNVKDVARERYTEPSRTLRRESAARARERARQERMATKSQKLEEKKERLAQKLVDKQNRKTIADLKKAIDDASLNGARREVERLAAKRDKVKEKALLKEEQKMLKKELKNAKKDAEKEAKEKFSRKKIQSLTDEELNDRINRLRSEATLVKLEAERNLPAGVKVVGDAMLNAGQTAVTNIAREGFTALGNKFLKAIGLSEVLEDTPARRLQNLRNELEEKKVRKELEEYGKDTSASRTKKMREELDEMRVRDELANYGKEKEKDQYSEAGIKARKEMERRVKAYRGDGDTPNMTIAEIAKRMNITEDQVKDLLYQ